MDDDLIELVSKVFLADDLPVPRFGHSKIDAFAVLSFIKETLSSQVHHRSNESRVIALNKSFNERLLAQYTNIGKGLPYLLISKLKPLLSRSSSFEKTPERRVLACCLLYTLRLKPRIPVSDIELLLELFSDASSFLRPNEAAHDFWTSSRMIMFSTLQALLPEESGERAAEYTDESLLESLAASSALANYFQGTPDISDPMRLVLQFAYVLLQMRCSRMTTQTASQDRLDDCYKVGVFRALYKVLTDYIFTQGMHQSDQILCFEISYRLLTMLFEVESRRIISRRHILYTSTKTYLKDSKEDGKCDNYLTLVKCLALIFSYCPNVITQSDSEQARCFVAWLPESGFMQSSAKMLIGYINLISSLSTGEDGSDRIFTQMTESARNQFSVTSEGFKYICWDFILESLVLFGRVLTGTGPKLNAIVRTEEMEGFTAYMKLFGRLFSYGSPEQTAQRIQLLESEFKSALESQKLTDLFLLIFCKAVPSNLKAAACKAIVGVGRTEENALYLLNNLRTVGLFITDHDPRRIVRRYLQVQLMTVEAHSQDYTFTIACIDMINELLMQVGKLQNRETALVEVTLFCKDALLEALLNHLSFSYQEQLWDLLSAAFMHFQICLERIELEEFFSTDDRKSPSQLVLHDVLAQGVIYKAIGSCISKAFLERSSNKFPENSANRAVTNALELILAVFQTESRVQHPPTEGFRPFRISILENKFYASLITLVAELLWLFRDFVQRSLFNVSRGLPKLLQCSAVDLMRELYGSNPDQFGLLDPDFQSLLIKELPDLFHDSISVL